ncbi:hypothetical protein ACB092_01G068900 [Castanea dentata]
MAKQSKSALLSGFTEEEIETANTMLEFHQQFVEFKTHPQIQSWVGLKRRSKRLPRQSLGCFHFSLSSSPAFTHGGVEVGPTPSPTCKTEAPTVAVKAGTLSPVTPLSFSLGSESDDKPKNALKFKIVKRKREDWLEITEGLTQNRDFLKREIGNAMRCYDGLKAFNLELKARKHEFCHGHMKENPYLEDGERFKLAKGFVQVQPTANSLINAQNQDHQQQIHSVVKQKLFIVNQRVQRSEIDEKLQHPTRQMHSSLPTSTGFGCVVNNNEDPSSLPDLNVSIEDTVGVGSSGPSDLTVANRISYKAMAAQARQRRIQICRVKKLHCH